MRVVWLGLAVSFPGWSAAASTPSLLGISARDGTLSIPLQIILLLTLLTVLPAAVMSVTPFLRIVVVLHFLRQALGTQSTPSNQVLIGLALFLTLVIVQPVGRHVPPGMGAAGGGEAFVAAGAG